MSGEERWLRRRVEELREEERRAAPPFARPDRLASGPQRERARRSPRPPRWGWTLAAATLAALLAVGLWWGPSQPPPSAEPGPMELAAALSEWSSPLDFLLDVPGGEIVSDEGLVPPGHARDLIDLVETEPWGSWEEM